MNDNRAYQSLLNYLHTFCLNQLIMYEAKPRPFNSFKNEGFIIGEEPKEGDLVQLSAAPYSKWQLSWYHKYDTEHDQHLLESIQDGSLCNWSNISLNVFTRETVNNNPQWRWTNKQFEFLDKWNKALKAEDAYIYPSNGISFSEDLSTATISIRVRYGLSAKTAELALTNWNKITIKALRQNYLVLVQDLKALQTKESKE